jgi:Tfp pilus assembly major pilin PilA
VGDFIAKDNIPVGGVLAYTRGQRVSADAVKANGWEDLVVGENTKEAKAIHADITGQPVDEPDTKTSAPATRAAATSSEQKG